MSKKTALFFVYRLTMYNKCSTIVYRKEEIICAGEKHTHTNQTERRNKMIITKVNEKIINLEKDNQTITITWKEMLYLLDEFIYAAEGTRKEIKSEVLDL